MLEPDPAKRRDTFKQYISVNALEKRFATLYGLTAGADIRYAPIHESIEGLKKDIDKKLEKKTPKRIAVTVCALAAAAVLTGILITLGSRAAGKVVPVQTAVSEQIVDDFGLSIDFLDDITHEFLVILNISTFVFGYGFCQHLHRSDRSF